MQVSIGCDEDEDRPLMMDLLEAQQALKTFTEYRHVTAASIYIMSLCVGLVKRVRVL